MGLAPVSHDEHQFPDYILPTRFNIIRKPSVAKIPGKLCPSNVLIKAM
jgi:hypothetical protein